VVVAAFLADGDGSYSTRAGTGNDDGTFTVPDVPAGEYVLTLGGMDHLWTSLSDINLVGNATGRSTALRAVNASVGFSMDLNRAVGAEDQFEWCSPDVASDNVWDASGSGQMNWSAHKIPAGYLLDTTQHDEVYLNHLQQTSPPGPLIANSGPSPRIVSVSDWPAHRY
jgi:hypothetical protein